MTITIDILCNQTFLLHRFTDNGYALFGLDYKEMIYVMVNKTSFLYKKTADKRPPKWINLAEPFKGKYP